MNIRSFFCVGSSSGALGPFVPRGRHGDRTHAVCRLHKSKARCGTHVAVRPQKYCKSRQQASTTLALQHLWWPSTGCTHCFAARKTGIGHMGKCFLLAYVLRWTTALAWHSLQLTGPVALGLEMQCAGGSKTLPQVHDVAGTCCKVGPCCFIIRVPAADNGRCNQHQYCTSWSG